LKNDQAGASNGSFTRRQWLGRVPPSALAAFLIGGSAEERELASGQVKNDPEADDLGAHVYNIRRYGASKSTVETCPKRPPCSHIKMVQRKRQYNYATDPH
jgi:hypothetical protein